ncbi:MAG: class I tRNA ligase family protein, partial [Caldilineaceae bacterium]|nr:class I tRNA ligase family protein [Caldilineaceae bacterium]
DFIAEMTPKFRRMVEVLGCSNDDFIRTTEARHHASVSELWRRMAANGDIYLGSYAGWYSVRDEAFYGDDELEERDGVKVAVKTGTPVEWVEEESYFFRLSAYQQNRPVPDLELGEAISLTVTYGLGAASLLDETPELYYWDGGAWSQEELTCMPGGDAAELDCVYAGGVLTQFALLASEPEAVAGIALSSATSSATAEVGTSVDYRFTLTNTGTTTDTFSVDVTGPWTPTSSTSNVGPLASGNSAVFTVTVTIPAGAADGESATTTVTATSALDGSVQQTGTLTTMAQRPPDEEPEEDDRIFLPMIQRMVGSAQSAQITGISISGDRYVVSISTPGFTPQLPGQHVHFFFNTVPPEQAGAPGAGAWHVHGDSGSYSGITLAERPSSATQICVLVANPDHSVQLNTGNCYPLP